MRRVGEGYEIEVQNPETFFIGAQEWLLTIGDTTFATCWASPAVGNYGLVYPVSATEFAALEDGSPILVHYGPCCDLVFEYGFLRKSEVVD